MELSHLFATWCMAYMIEYVTDFVLICNIQMYLCVLSHSEISESQVADGSENVCGTFFRDGPPPKATKVKSPVDLQVFHPQGIFFNQARVIVQLCMYGGYKICRSGGLPETWLSSWSEQCVASGSAAVAGQDRTDLLRYSLQ